MNTPDSSTPVLSEEYDPTTGDPYSLLVVRSVAVAADQDPLDLPPLGETIDIDALESLVDSCITADDAALTVTFEYAGYLVCIDDHGTLTLHENGE